MRIIAGDYKGRRLETPKDGTEIRPTSDKVKEAIFSMVSPYLEQAVVVDLFTGTGNLGIEALSRGAEHVFFCDRSSKSLALAKRNVEHCKAGENNTFLHGDWEQAISRLRTKVDLFFLDPPYKAPFTISCIEQIEASGLLNDDGILVVEHSTSLDLPSTIGSLQILKERRYGSIQVTIYSVIADDTEE